MSLPDELKDIFGKLSYEWYLNKKKEYQSNNNYDSHDDKIIVKNSSLNYNDIDEEGHPFYNKEKVVDGDTDGQYVISEEVTTFTGFCLYSEETDEIYLDQKYKGKLYTCYNVGLEITAAILKQLKGNNDPYITYKIINTAYNILQDELESLRSIEKHKDFIELLEQGLAYISGMINMRFQNHLQIHALTSDFEDKLKFKLNQEKLASLLYLLTASDFISSTENELIHFAQNYFYFHNQQKKTHTKASQLRSKFNDAKNKVHFKARDSVISDIEKAIFSIKKKEGMKKKG